MNMSPSPVLPAIMSMLLLTSATGALARPAQRAQRPAPPARAPFLQRVKSFEETQYVSKVVLKNGMTVVVNEFHALPVVSVMTFIRAGYAAEPADLAGISRLMQRTLFQGTTNRTVAVIRQDTQALGGTLTGHTRYGDTVLESVVPAMQWKKALEVQTDILLNPVFDAEALKREAGLTALEILGEQDDPDGFAREKLLELGFPGRSRRWAATVESLRAISREKVLDYYRSFYGPSRTILVVAGDVSASEVLNEAVRLYDTPRGVGEKPLPAGDRGAQSGFGYAELHGDVQVPRVLFGFHTCPVESDDYPPVAVLHAILGVGEGSVLSARLRDQKKVILEGETVLAGPGSPGYLTLSMKVDPADVDKSEIGALTELELIKRKSPEAADMERALAQLERMHWESLQTVSGRAKTLALYESLGDWKGMDRYVTRLRRVKPEDVSRVAKKYLSLENCSLLEFLPSAAEPRNLTAQSAYGTFRGLIEASTDQEAAERERETQLALDIPTAPGSYKFSEVRFQLRTASVLRGPDLFIKEDHTAPLIQMGFFFPGGKLLETKENSGITMLMLSTMLRGTQDRGPDRYMRQMELYGGHIVPVVTDDYSGYLLSVLSRNVDGALGLLGDAIKTPEFDKDELSRRKQLQAADVRMQSESPTAYPRQLLLQSLFKDHPYGAAAEGTEKSLSAIGADAIQAWYQSEIRNKKPLAVILGDTQGTTLASYFVKNFSGSRFQDIKLPETFAKPPEQNVVSDKSWDKNRSLVLIGFQAPPEADEDSFPVEVLRSYFAGNGGKLPSEIIDKQGLAYRVAMDYRRGIRGGSLIVCAATSSADAAKAGKAIMDEFSRFLSNPVMYRDYRSAVNTAAGSFVIATQERNSQIAVIVENVLSGRGIDEFQAYTSHIQDVKQDDLQEIARRVLLSAKNVTLRMQGRP